MALLIVVVVAGSFTYAYSVVLKHVTLVVDGRPESIATTSSNVGSFLLGQGISLGSRLQVAPPPSTSLADGMTVIVSPAPAAARVTDGLSSNVGVWVTERTSRGRAAWAAELVEASASAVGVGLSPAVAVHVVVLGKVHDVVTNASTAGELLSAMGIQPDADDRVAPSPSTPLHSGDTVRFARVTVATLLQRIAIPAPVHSSPTDNLRVGTYRIVSPAIDGEALLTERVTRVNGKIRNRDTLSRWVTAEPIAGVRLVGTLLAAPPPPSTGTHSQTGVATWYHTPWSGLTAAHLTLPFGTRVTVTDLDSGRSVVVVINDRGPYGDSARIIDLSPAAFEALGHSLSRGVLNVRITW